MSVNVSDLAIGNGISFETVAPGLLPRKFEQVTYNGLVSGDIARTFRDVVSLHKQIYGSLDQNVIRDDYRAYDYILFTLPDGSIDVMGLPWIKPNTLVVQNTVSLALVFPNLTPTKAAYLHMVLKGNGFDNYFIPDDWTKA